jgi:hypothetical protein
LFVSEIRFGVFEQIQRGYAIKIPKPKPKAHGDGQARAGLNLLLSENLQAGSNHSFGCKPNCPGLPKHEAFGPQISSIVCEKLV